MNLKQFKLTNDEEIICEVLEIGDDTGDVVVRKALKIMCAEDFENHLRYYSFRPYMSFSDITDQIVVLNAGHIISEVQPTKRLVTHYALAIKEVEGKADRIKDFDFEEFAEAVGDMSDDEIRQYIREHIDREEETRDSAETNIIAFKPRDTLH